MENTEFSVGDIIKLKSGGPEMTIQKVLPSIEHYQCQWFAGKKLDSGKFPFDSVIKV